MTKAEDGAPAAGEKKVQNQRELYNTSVNLPIRGEEGRDKNPHVGGKVTAILAISAWRNTVQPSTFSPPLSLFTIFFFSQKN